MAKTHVYYEVDKATLCFACAVKAVIKYDKDVVLRTTDYEFDKCEVCDKFIMDEVEI